MDVFWESLVNDLWSLHLAIMGILVSVLTLLYASLCGKVEELDSIKQSEEFILMNRATAVRNYINQLRSLNKQVMLGLIISFCLFVLTTIIKYLPEECVVIKWITSFNSIATIGLLVFGIKLAREVYSQYQKETKKI